MKRAFFILLILLSFLLETKVSLFGIMPNFLVLPVYYYGLKRGGAKGLLFGAFMGAAVDTLYGNMLGPNILSKGAAGFLSHSIKMRFFRWTPFLGMLGAFLITAIDGYTAYASLSIFDAPPTAFSRAFFIISAQAILNSVAGLILRPKDED
jgi:rod shape-determining protein MreD